MTVDNNLDERFWQWCLNRYENRELRESLLEAQDTHGVIVLEVMLAAWLAERGVPYDAAVRRAALARARPWHDEVVAPLRVRRGVWKTDRPPALYERIKQLELQAERELAALLVAGLPGLDAGPAIECRKSLMALVADGAGDSDGSAACLRRLAHRFDQIS